VASSKVKKAAAGGLIAISTMLAIPFITDREGESLEAYRDSVGVWTICNGETYGVKPGDRRTKEECRLLTKSRVGQFMAQVAASITVPVTPEQLAAHTSFAYNIGIAGYRRSSTLRLTNAGKPVEGCQAMMMWHKAGGRDCRIRANNCYGIITRREDEIKLCLTGLN
jgi:lysozyme